MIGGGMGAEAGKRNREMNAAIDRLVERMQQRRERGDEAETKEESQGQSSMSELLQALLEAETRLMELVRQYRSQEPWFIELLHYMDGRLGQAEEEEDKDEASLLPATAREQFVEHRGGIEEARRRNEAIITADLGVREMIQAELEYRESLHPAARQHARALCALSRRLASSKAVIEALQLAVEVETYLEMSALFLQQRI